MTETAAVIPRTGDIELDGLPDLYRSAAVTRLDPVLLPVGFRETSEAVLRMLDDVAPMGAWMITQVIDGTWTVLSSLDRSYGVEPGVQIPWQDTLCYRMVNGTGPRVAPDLALVPAYATAPAAQMLPICAYAGVEIVTGDGELFGTLCAVDPQPQPMDPRIVESVLRGTAAMLSRILTTELALRETQRGFERAATAAETDFLTGLRNRRGWDVQVHRAAAAADALGLPTAVIVVDLDGLKAVNDTRGHDAGDTFLRAAADALSESCRAGDTVARLGGDEFAVLLPNTEQDDATRVVGRISDALRRDGVAASIGAAYGHQYANVLELMSIADQVMYRDKEQRVAARLRTTSH